MVRSSPRRGAAWDLLGAAALLAGLAALVGLAAGFLGGAYKGYDGEAAEITIPRGATLGEVASLLKQAGVVRSEIFFRIQAAVTGRSQRIQAGEYRFEGALSSGAVLRRLVAGAVVLHRMTFPEGLTGPEIIDQIAAASIAPREELLAAFRDPALVREVDPEARDLEGYLFPDTYHFARPTPAAQIFEKMIGRFREEFGDELRRKGAALGLSVREAVTMASLIEKETSVPHERARVSAVFHNRLKRGMPLQCDPTVIYALERDGLYGGALTREDLRHTSPYNTYVNPGLPPGPIAAPGRAALEAAVTPASVPDLYFVADGSGGHAFSRTLEEHLRAVSRYRRLNRQGA